MNPPSDNPDDAPLSRLDVLRGLRVSTWEGVWATAWAILTGGAFQIGFALYLGATPLVLGLLAGLPAIVGLLQLPASLYGDKLPKRRPFVAASSALGRLLWIVIAFLPFVLPLHFALWVFLVLLTVSSALLTIVVPAWTSWMSDLVPSGSRGQYFARRSTVAGFVSMLLPLPAGAFLDLAVKRDLFAPQFGFAVLFLLSAVAALASFFLIRKQPEPPRQMGEATQGGFRTLLVPLADRNFRPFLSFAALTVCSQTLAGQFFTAWQVDKAALNLPYLVVQILGAVASGAGLLATPIWGYLNDKYGSRPLLAIASGGVIVAPFIWLFTVPSAHAFWLNVGLIIIINLFSGVAWGGVGLAQFNLLLANSPAQARTTYVAMFSAATGVLGGVSPVVGGFLMTALQNVHIDFGPVAFNNYKILFTLTGLIRIACLFLLARVPSGGENTTRYVLNQLQHARKPITSFLTLRRLSRPANEETRREAVADLADLKTPLAVEELAAALDDVSLEVREGAVRALGATGDIRATPALVQKMADPAAQIGELCAEALAQIGDKEAVPVLVTAAQGPDAGLRVAALRALSRLADASALPVVLAALDPAHAATCEAACSALGAMASGVTSADLTDALPRLGYLLSQEVDRGMRLASARALARLSEVDSTKADARFIWNTLSGRMEAETDGAVAAQEAVALQKWGRKASKTPSEIAARLLPVLDHAPLSALAYKQTLGAIADTGLPAGTLYPYLGIDPLDFDETLHRFLSEWAKRVGTHSAAVAPVLETFGKGDFRGSLQQIAAFAPPHVKKISGTDALVTLLALSRRADRAQTKVRPEEVLLAALLLRNTTR